jgi:hypothetical protein
MPACPGCAARALMEKQTSDAPGPLGCRRCAGHGVQILGVLVHDGHHPSPRLR